MVLVSIFALVSFHKILLPLICIAYNSELLFRLKNLKWTMNAELLKRKGDE